METYDGPYPAPDGITVTPKAFPAVGVAIAMPEMGMGPGRGSGWGEAVLMAMTQAVRDAQAEGITDPGVLQERVLIARDYAMLSVRGEGTGLDIMAKAIADAQAIGMLDPHEIAASVLRALQVSQVALETANQQ